METLLEIFLTSFIKQGSLQVETHARKTFSVGDGTGPHLAVRFVGGGSEFRLMQNPELAFGEMYMDGALVVVEGTLYDLLTLVQLNLELVGNVAWMKPLHWARMAHRRLQQRNNLNRSRRNVAFHYDLSGKLYSLFLDKDRQYSSAYFEYEGQGLDDAQLAKKRHIASKLLIEPSHRVLEIGCGWGGLALYIANFCGADVTGITLSKEQLSVAKDRAVERQLENKLEFRLQDYRKVKSKFDRIVSVGMLEHVGVGYLADYFRTIRELLTPDGVAVVYAIGRTGPPDATNPWTDKYIFPGGYIPAMSEVTAAIERSHLVVTDIEISRLHYAETLKFWREHFAMHRQEAEALYDERFCRMWEFYLAGSEVGFRLGWFVVFQFQIARDIRSVPLTRDYIAQRESRLRERDGERRASPIPNASGGRTRQAVG